MSGRRSIITHTRTHLFLEPPVLGFIIRKPTVGPHAITEHWLSQCWLFTEDKLVLSDHDIGIMF